MFFTSISAYDKTEHYLSNNAEYVVKLYSELVYRIAVSQMGNRHDADDVFQEVFLAYFKKDRCYTEEEHRKAWLIKTTVMVSRRVRSQRAKRAAVALDEVPDVAVGFDHPSESDIWMALMEIPPKYRLVLTLYYFEEMSVKEIGKSLNTNENAIYARLSRGRKMMKERLEELGRNEA